MQTVVIADYDPEWPSIFERLRSQISAALGSIVLAIEHVGSTSVPNLPAKPIIDLDVVVRVEDIAAATAAIEALGYRHDGNLGVEGRDAFRCVADDPEHHLYLCREDSPALRSHLIFRDYLRAHPEAAIEYAELKRRLASQCHHDRARYQDAKADFVESLNRRAEEFARKKVSR